MAKKLGESPSSTAKSRADERKNEDEAGEKAERDREREREQIGDTEKEKRGKLLRVMSLKKSTYFRSLTKRIKRKRNRVTCHLEAEIAIKTYRNSWNHFSVASHLFLSFPFFFFFSSFIFSTLFYAAAFLCSKINSKHL